MSGQPPTRSLRHYGALSLLVFASVAAPLILLEVLLRLNVVPNDYYARNNVLGKESDGPLVLILGDSFMASQKGGDIVDFVFQNLDSARFRIRNTARSGTGPVEYLRSVRRERQRHKPDVLLLAYYAGNDLLDTGCGGDVDARLEPAPDPPAWQRSYTVQFFVERLRAILPGRVIVETAVAFDRSSFALPPGTALITAPLGVITPLRIQAVDYEAMRRAGIPEQHIEAAKRGEVNPWIVNLGANNPGYFRDALFVQSPCARRAWEEQTRILDMILDEAASMNVRVLPVIFPHTFQVSTAHYELYRSWKIAVDDEMLRTDRPQQLLTQYFHGRGLEPLDLLKTFRAQKTLLYWERDEHLNVVGQQLAAGIIADAILAGGPGTTAERGPARARPMPVKPGPPANAMRAVLPLAIDFSDTTWRRWIDGWYPAEIDDGRTYAWSRGQRSLLRIALPDSHAIRMDFEAMPLSYDRAAAQSVAVVIDGKRIAHTVVRPGLHKYSLVLPAEALAGSPQAVELRYAYTRAPRSVIEGSSDARMLAIAWYSLTFARVER